MIDQISYMLTESFIKTIPTLLVVTFGVLILRNVLDKYLRQDRNYKEDKFRLEMERKLFELNESMLRSQERFSTVNHLVLEGNATHSSSFLESMGVSKDIQVKDKSAFVLTPFHPEFDESYEWIKSFFIDHDYTCTRGDAVLAESNVLSHIISAMLESEIVVANISGRNPNVFYELGIAHALGKKVVLVARSKEDITFDVSNSQIAIYKDRDSLNSSLSRWLVSILRN
ncbi:nucleoside 2-deoxyribosyltransferase [Microbulbifer agarilyticus]|uniref:nucleoside 2-deoxyribosyltransferase n=1 Tax=Microbulbifer agarilyticus TaxID=260552 RepID=UPI001CD29C8C|nr:nucleoside 2-deoxyribosyltransferase [Microbulbifer agarilyticus]MCA0902028.1 nucleoside 2-deoxyribosyltransferase [Microbulbifer agarilyticus]